MKFTQTNVTKLSPPSTGDVTIWDDGMSGFGIRFRNGGEGIFTIKYSVDNRQGKLGLGKVSQVKLEDAKIAAAKAFALIADGKDPQAERAKQALAKGAPFGDKIDEFFTHLEKLGRSAGYVGDHRRCLDRYMTKLHRSGVGEITRAMIAEELDKIEKNNGRRQAGLARSYIHGFFSWAMTKGLVEQNPAEGTEKRNSERRERVFDPAELVAIWRATEGDDQFYKIVRLLMLTAARKTQIGSLNRRTELNMEGKLLDFIPPHVRKQRGESDVDRGKTKNKERFWLPLSSRAVAILNTVPEREGSDFVFGEGNGGFSGWSSAKAQLDKKLGDTVGEWTFHDFRRTFESLGIDACKIPWNVTDVCLHHVGEHKKGVKRTYNHATYIDEKREAMEKWAAYIGGLVHGEVKLAAV